MQTAISKLKEVLLRKQQERELARQEIHNTQCSIEEMTVLINELEDAVKILEDKECEHDARSEETPRPDPV